MDNLIKFVATKSGTPPPWEGITDFIPVFPLRGGTEIGDAFPQTNVPDFQFHYCELELQTANP